ncbi:MAG: hypothetical protein HZB91_06290, partial [Elusimicrobia bacterium]|nr:hypothetical protein [Elusimicrobiota bacterium]
MKRRPYPLALLVAATFTGLAGIHYLASRRVPVGVFNDDAFFILLAKSLRKGAFALPDGTPVTDPLPGFSALLMLPAWAVEPRWHLLQLLVVACGLLAVFLTWRLALRFLSRPWALSAALLTGLNPVLVGLGGIVIPDIPYLALSLALFLGVGAIRTASPWWNLPVLVSGAGLACLMRPQGALLTLGLGVAVWVRLGRVQSLAFMGGALAPLAVWLCRNLLAGRTVTGFVSNWKSQFFLFPGPLEQANHFISLVGSMFGQGLIGATGPQALSAGAGFACLLLAGHGAVRLTKSPEGGLPAPGVAGAGVPPPLGTGSGLAAGMASYVILVLALHATWPLTEARYLIPLLPFAVILILASLRTWLDKLGPAALLLLAAQSLALLRYDLAFAGRGWGPRPLFEPETMAWLCRNTPPEARIESLAFHGVELFAGRKAVPPG